MAKQLEFEGEFFKGPQGGTYLDFPFDAAREFGQRGTIRIKIWFDGQPYRMSLLPHGNGRHWLHIRREIRWALGKSEGDKVKVVVEPDEEPPSVEIPDYLKWLLEDDREMNQVFEKLTYSMKKQLIEYINQPKTDDARVHRVNRFFEFLNEWRQKKGKSVILPQDEP